MGWLVQIAAAQEPRPGTRELLKLIPPDSAVVLTIDDLRGQVHELLSSKLATQFQELPAVKAWFDSEKYEQLETARDQIEGTLQAKLTAIRDEVLGDAVVFALRLSTEGPGPFDPSRARGLLVLKARDSALLKRLIDLFNTIQKNNGEIAAVLDRKRGETSYTVRTFPDGSNRQPDAYATFADGTFAISNSEELIQQLIDRKTGKAEVGAISPAGPAIIEKFEDTMRRLPARALCRLFVDARLAKGLLANAPPSRSPAEALLRRYIEAHQSAGAALVIHENRLALDVAEIFDPGKLHKLLGTSTRGPKPMAPRLDRVPASTLLVGTFHVDFAWLYRTVRELIPEPQRPRLTNGETVLKGLLLGQDIQTQILPAIGPRVLAMVDGPAGVETQIEADGSPNGKWLFPTVIAVELERKPESDSSAVGSAPRQVPVAEALDNALNTFLACLTFDHRFGQTPARIVSREVSGATVKSLEPHIPLAYALDRPGHRLVLGSSPAAVERYLKAGSDPAAGSRFRQLQTQGFANADSFLCVDLVAVQELLIKHRDRLTDTIANQRKRPRKDVAYDLEQVLALSRLFDAAYLTSRVDSDAATIFHAIGLVARPADQQTSPAQVDPAR